MITLEIRKRFEQPWRWAMRVPAMLGNVGRLLKCGALWTAWMAGASAQQQGPGPPENQQLLQQRNQVEADAAERQRSAVLLLRQLPVDPDECALSLLVDLMGQTTPDKQVRRYVSVFDRDMDTKLQRLLRQRGIEAKPYSALTRDTRGHDPYFGRQHTDFWHFSVFMDEKLGDTEYALGAGYHCGSLCFARLRYTVKIAGAKCAVVSKELIGIS